MLVVVGVMTAVFGDSPFAAQSGPIEALAPVMILAREMFGFPWTTRCSWCHGCTRKSDAREGLTTTAGVFTAAVILVFGAFLLNFDRSSARGLAVAVLAAAPRGTGTLRSLVPGCHERPVTCEFCK
ncbi:hypothetical protein [Amycolatopsis sp. NPDC051071]|uniref:hypothetical protein n=1 Tax=Amycolatopsis sp. NPDC051071 TaxID=3154637 RepID=UPI003413FAA9